MSKLIVRLLGGYRVELDGETLYGFETDKARALLAFLAVEADRPHRRETLAGLLWPDRPDSVARANLRQALSALRRALSDYQPPLFLFVTSTDVQFNTACDYTLDVAELEAFAVPPAPRGEVGAHLLQLLPEALCADFLAGFAVPDSEAFQAWVLNRQEHYHRLALEILDEQNAYFECAGEYEQAVAAARRQLRIEPWFEEAHRRCMRGLALAGRRDEALHQYEICCRVLKTELGVEPAASTQALYTEVRAGRLTGVKFPIGQGAGRGEVMRAKLASSPLQATPARPPTTLVAREDELGQLSRHLEAALAGETGVVFVSGDAGSGKTALLEAFAASAMAEHSDLLVAGARCSPGGSLDAFAPLRRLAEMLFGDLGNDVSWRFHGRGQVDRLLQATDLVVTALAKHGHDLIDTLVAAASVTRRAEQAAQGATASAILGGSAAPLPLKQSPDRAALSQGALFDQFLCTLGAISREQPLLLLLDDLHWVDDASAAFLLHSGRELQRSRVLLVGAYRSATVALGRRNPRSGEIDCHPLTAVVNELRRIKGEIVVELDRADGRAFVEAYVDTEPNRLGARFRDALYAQTGGQALFTVETLRNLQARGELVKDDAGRWIAAGTLDWGALPARVEAAIAERIERLPEASRRLLSCASVEGDDFSGEIVAEMTGIPVREVLACLSGFLARQHHLVRPEGLERVGCGQRSMYRFVHHLFQKYLYDQLDPVERAQLHAAVATSLERQAGCDPVERERLSARLAWHYETGGLPLSAARALHDAGRQAMRVSAFREALDRFDHGLALLADAPPGPERREIAWLLEVARLGPQRNLEWMTSEGVKGILAQAAEAWAGAPSGAAEGRPKLMLVWGQAERLMATGQFEDALAAATRLRDLAQQWGEEDFIALAHLCLGLTHQYMGDLLASERHLEQVLAELTPEQRAGLRAAIGVDVHANALADSALNRWFLGNGEAALARSREALAAARAEGAAVGKAAAAGFGANLLFFLRNDERSMAELSEQCLRQCREHGLGMWGVFAEVLAGRLMVMRGEDISGIERMRSDTWRDSGMVIGVDFFAVVLADSCLLAAGRRAAGDPVRASLLAKGLATVDSILGPDRIPCGPIYKPELHRLQGELLLARDGVAAAGEVLACFERAMALGREKGALAWQLRAATSVARLRARQGEAYEAELADARRRLADVYARFSEGFAFPDLQDAAACIGDGNDYRHTETA